MGDYVNDRIEREQPGMVQMNLLLEEKAAAYSTITDFMLFAEEELADALGSRVPNDITALADFLDFRNNR